MPLKWKDLVVTIKNTGTVTEWDMDVAGDEGPLRCFMLTDHVPTTLAAQALQQSDLSVLHSELEGYLEAISDPAEIQSLKAKFQEGVDQCVTRLDDLT